MASSRRIKILILTLFSVLIMGWLITGSQSRVLGDTAPNVEGQAVPADASGEYVGSDTCKACHEDQAKNFAGTKHAKLQQVESWKDKVQGCESCHGPGKKHVEDPTVKGSIVSFANKDSKAISETCLTCHSGRESHNNFRRGEHWRNDVGCTECHSPHSPAAGGVHEKPGSASFISNVSIENPNRASTLRLKASEPQLCLSCHAETKSQFTKPFHHKVLEGAMKCSDCHNPHGGFEQKQTKLAIGNDAVCIKCHGDKQGPFVFEHAPLKTEGCSACHTPHGSSNPKMLNRSSVRQLCMECHTQISETEAPTTPSLHNQANVRYQNCTVCHGAIHGSNSSNRLFRQ